MNLESENNKILKDFFGKEYRNLKSYVNKRIQDTANSTAEDIIQDVALKLFAGADRYAPINNVAGFVYRSIKNRIIDIMRSGKQSNYIDSNIELLKIVDVIHYSSESNNSENKIEILKKCIEELKPVYKNIIIAVDIEGYSYKEISEETGIPEGTLMSRRHRAIGLLYKNIELNKF